jgi:hypothetical protein
MLPIPNREQSQPPRRRHLAPAEHARRLQAYYATLSDEQAAARAALPHSTFRRWRISQALPSRWHRLGKYSQHKPTLPPEEHARRRHVYETSTCAAEAARRLGLPGPAFHIWRIAHGLPPMNDGRFLSAAEHARRLAAYDTTKSDARAAKLLGITPKAACDWRRAQNLQPNHGPQWRAPNSLPLEEEQRRVQALNELATDDARAARLGITKDAFQQWRRKRGYGRGYGVYRSPTNAPSLEHLPVHPPHPSPEARLRDGRAPTQYRGAGGPSATTMPVGPWPARTDLHRQPPSASRQGSTGTLQAPNGDAS